MPKSKTQTGSFLVRIWKEAGETGEDSFRGYIRDLKTGEERYVADPEHLLERLLAAGRSTERDRAEDDAGGRVSELDSG